MALSPAKHNDYLRTESETRTRGEGGGGGGVGVPPKYTTAYKPRQKREGWACFTEEYSTAYTDLFRNQKAGPVSHRNTLQPTDLVRKLSTRWGLFHTGIHHSLQTWSEARRWGLFHTGIRHSLQTWSETRSCGLFHTGIHHTVQIWSEGGVCFTQAYTTLYRSGQKVGSVSHRYTPHCTDLVRRWGLFHTGIHYSLQTW